MHVNKLLFFRNDSVHAFKYSISPLLISCNAVYHQAKSKQTLALLSDVFITQLNDIQCLKINVLIM